MSKKKHYRKDWQRKNPNKRGARFPVSRHQTSDDHDHALIKSNKRKGCKE